MSQFNSTSKSTTKTTSYEGGTVYKKTLEDEWSNLLFSYLLQKDNNPFYESASDRTSRYIDLTEQMVKKYGPEFVGKAAIFSRNQLGMRTISELTAAILNRYSWDNKRKFYAKYFRRPDGVGEVFGAVEFLGNKRSHALIRGAADYLENLDAYKVGKYNMRNKSFNMHDLINLTHAKSQVLDKYQKGTLEKPDTWEFSIHAGMSEDEIEREWKRLVESGGLGYLALLRNLKKIVSCSFASWDWIETYLIPKIENEHMIHNSLVWPIQIYTAYKVIESMPVAITLKAALSKAFDFSIGNMPNLDGKTLCVIDVSGSMDSSLSAGSMLTIKEASAVYASSLLIDSQNDVDCIKFGNHAKWFGKDITPTSSAIQIVDDLCENDGCGYGTEMTKVFDLLDKHYDRIIVFSDMQVMGASNYWYGYNDRYTMQSLWNAYQEKYGMSHMYSFDLGEYGTQVVSQNESVTYITALNNYVYKAIAMMEDKNQTFLQTVENSQF